MFEIPGWVVVLLALAIVVVGLAIGILIRVVGGLVRASKNTESPRQ